MKAIKVKTIGLIAVYLSAQASLMHAQVTEAPPPADTPPVKPPLSSQELEQLVAPIALYPDSLLTQVFMASTYPLEIVQADRWLKANQALQGDALAKELEKQPWDPSVKSIVNFPEVLGLMSDQLDLTVKLGDAFLAQEADVMNTVQILRNKAQATGNLQNNDQQKIIVEAAPPPAPTVVYVQAPPPQIIKIESPSPTVIYVPTYNPTVVYGAWPYPAYPPYPYYPPRPPGYVATAAISFGVGVACGAAWGYAWGNSNWGRGDVNINVNQNVNFNSNINRNVNSANLNTANGSWQHNPAHRQGVPYSNQAAAQKFGNASSAQTAQAREAYRGRTDAGAGTSPIQNRPGTGTPGGATPNRPGAGTPGSSTPPRPSTGNPGSVPARPGSGTPGGATPARPSAPTPAARPSTGASGALSGVGAGGNAANTASQRGAASRGTAPAQRPAGGSGTRAPAGRGGR